MIKNFQEFLKEKDDTDIQVRDIESDESDENNDEKDDDLYKPDVEIDDDDVEDDEEVEDEDEDEVEDEDSRFDTSWFQDPPEDDDLGIWVFTTDVDHDEIDRNQCFIATDENMNSYMPLIYAKQLAHDHFTDSDDTLYIIPWSRFV